MRKIYFKKNQISLIFFCCPASRVLSLFGHNFFSWPPIGKKLYSYEDDYFFYLQKKFQKIITKIETMDTCANSNLSPKGTIIL